MHDNEHKHNKHNSGWSSKSRSEKNKIKLIILSCIGALIVFAFLMDFKNTIEKKRLEVEDEKKEMIDELEDDDGLSKDTKKVRELEDKYKDDLKDETRDSKEEESENEEELGEGYSPKDEFDYEAKYKELFDDEIVDKTLEDAKVVIDLYLSKNTKKESWKGLVSDSFLKNINNNIFKGNEKVKKGSEHELFFTEQYVENEIIVGVIVDFESSVEFFNIVFVQKNDGFVVDKIVSMWST